MFSGVSKAISFGEGSPTMLSSMTSVSEHGVGVLEEAFRLDEVTVEILSDIISLHE